ILTIPNVARCHASLGSSSATATLKRVRKPSLTLRTTWRLSLSECAPSIRISSVRCAIMDAYRYTKSRKPVSQYEKPFRNDCLNRCGLGECFLGHPLGDKRFDHVPGLDVTVVGDADSALHAVAHFAGIILEAPQGCDFTLKDNHIVAQQSNFGVALDDAIEHVASGDGPHLGNAEGLANLGASLIGFLDQRLKKTRHCTLHLVLQLVNDRVQTDVDLLLLREFLRLALWTYVEADDDRVRS